MPFKWKIIQWLPVFYTLNINENYVNYFMVYVIYITIYVIYTTYLDALLWISTDSFAL